MAAADFVVGNPPFLGTARMREALGDGYTEALRKVYPAVPDSADYVMYWWEKAAELARTGALQRFGLITTNSLRQTFNRRVLERHLHAEPPLSLRFAIPDHPWVDTVDGAAVRIAMTVASTSSQDGVLLLIRSERGRDDESAELAFEVIKGQIQADLTAGAAVIDAAALKANQELSSPGMKLHGAGFIVTPEEAAALGYGTEPGLEAVIKPYRNGRDLTQTPRNMLVIDLFGLSEQDVRERYPAVYQRVYERVKPERDQNRRASYRERWWIHGEPRANFRPALVGLNRYIATVETMRHRVFVFLDHTILPDNKLIAMAFDDAYYLGVLSSRIHVAWSLAAGSHLGVGNDPVYVKTACFEKFPFPMASAAQQARIRASAERLDAHRKRQQERHPTLTLTDMYNVLERLRALDPNPDREGGEGVSGSGVVPSLTVGVQRGGATLAADTAEARTPNPDRKGGEPAGSIEGLPSLTVGVQRGGATLAADTAEARTPNPDRKGGEPGGSIEGLPSLTVGVQRGGATLAADTAEARTPNPDRKGGEPGGSIEGLPSLTVGVQRGGATLAADTAEARTPNPDRKGGEPAGSIEGLPSLTVGVQRGGATLAADTAEARTPNPDRKGGEPGGGIEGLPSLTVGVRIASTRTLAEPAAPYQPIPLAYLITFRTYGTWLPGDENGTVDDTHNEPGTHMLPPDPRRESQARDLMDQPAYTLDAPRRDIVLQTIQEVCAYRGWSLLAAHVRTNHVHVVVHASQAPEKVMTDFKAYASRKLNAAGLDEPERKRWSRHGSTRYLWQPEHAEAAIRYVVHEQGESMAVYENQERIVTYAPVTFEKALKEASGVYVAQSLLDLPEFQIEDIDAPNPDREGGEHAGGSGAFPSLTVGVRRELPSPFTVKERVIHEQGLVSILRQLHDELDAAVADAYGWPADLPDGEILQRLVDLNAQRAAEEVSGLIRWLRPAYQQARAGVAPVQATLVEEEGGAEVAAPALAQPLPWPASMPEQARAVRGVLQQAVAPLSPAEVAARFGKADKARVAELLETLASLGQAEEEKGRYSAL
jgi:REP element-mobilizing transposase RayT